MTFRGRLVIAATSAVLVVVVLGSLATYLVAYNSLVGSVDANLSNDATDWTVLLTASTWFSPGSTEPSLSTTWMHSPGVL